MSSGVAHLAKNAQAALGLSMEERLEYIRKPSWIGYPRATAILQQLSSLVATPRGARMPGMTLMGASNNGKTSILQRFHRENEPYQCPTELRQVIPSVYVVAPIKPDERKMYTTIVESMGMPYKPNDAIANLEYKAYQLLATYRVKVLIVDEFHQLAAGPATKQREALNLLKSFSNRLSLSLVCAGTRQSIGLISLDTQFYSRMTPVPLEDWSNDRHWRTLLLSFERVLPLPEPSNLAGAEMASYLHLHSGGTIGGLRDLLIAATDHAIRGGKSRLSQKIFEDCGWRTPDKQLPEVQRVIGR